MSSHFNQVEIDLNNISDPPQKKKSPFISKFLSINILLRSWSTLEKLNW